MSGSKNHGSPERPSTARRVLLTGGAAGLAAVAGATFGRPQPASALTNPSITDWINVVTDVSPGADPTGTSDSTTPINNAIAALPANGGVVYLPAGRYKVTGAITASAVAPIYIIGAGRQATQINFTGNGDCVRMYNNYVPAGGPTSIRVWGGGIADLTIDGTNAGAGSTGLHIGDMKRAKVDINIQNFASTGSMGLHLDNTKWWTENGSFDLELINCTNGVVFDVTGGASEFDNNRFHFGLDIVGGQNGVVLQHGAYIYHADIFIHGGIRASATQIVPPAPYWAALAVTGTDSAGNRSYIEKSHLSIMLESGGSGSFNPQTIYQDAQGNRINECTGIMSFRLGPWVASNIIPAQVANQFTYYGIVDGDVHLNPGGNNGLAAISPVIYGQGNLNASGSAAGVFDAQQGDFFAVTLSETITIKPNRTAPETGDWPGPQRKTFVITQGTGGNSVGWPSNNTPTAQSPTVTWLSGSPPLMPAAVGAVLVVELITLDGATWYGSQPGS